MFTLENNSEKSETVTVFTIDWRTPAFPGFWAGAPEIAVIFFTVSGLIPAVGLNNKLPAMPSIDAINDVQTKIIMTETIIFAEAPYLVHV
jgi:hypothetical protein